MDPLVARFSPLDAEPVAGLSLVFQPASVFASSSSTLTLVVSVPIRSQSVSMTSTKGIAVTFPAADATNPPPTPLVTTLSGITTTPPDATWSIAGPRAGKFIIYPLNPTTLNPGDSFNFQFRNLSIVATVSTPSVTIQVTTSAGSNSTTLPINVQAMVPGVIAWADPPTVALNATSTLRWTSIGGATVVVSGFTSGNITEKDFPVGGITDPPHVNPTVDSGGVGSQHPYVVTLYAEPGHQRQGDPVTVQVYLHTPYIAQFGFVQRDNSVARSITINYGDQVTVQWRCVFVDPTQGILLSYGSTDIYNAPVSQYPFDPSTALTPNGDTVVVTLTAPGWNAPATDKATVTYKSIRVLYFKYTQWTSDAQGDHFSNMSFLTDPPVTQGAVVFADRAYPDVSCLSVQGPGGPLTQYLGTGNEPYLEIRYFSPSGPVTTGQPFTLQWFTNNATSLTLKTSGGTPTDIPSNQVAKGTSQPLTITAATDYILTATGSGGTVSSYLTVTPA
jgi:hypothetical protein